MEVAVDVFGPEDENFPTLLFSTDVTVDIQGIEI